MSVRKWIRIALVAATLVSFLSMTSACYGPFNLTRNLYKWNSQLKGTKEIGAKWMRGLVFPLLIPFYLLRLWATRWVSTSLSSGVERTRSDRHKKARTAGPASYEPGTGR